MTRFSLLASATAFLGLVACGKAPEEPSPPGAASEAQTRSDAMPSASSARANDVCSLLSDEEIHQATGYGVHARKAYADPGAPGCDWELKSSPQGGHRLSVTVQSPGGRKRFDFVSPSLPAIPNVGDAAVKTGGNINGTIWAITGDTLITLRYSLPVTTTDPDPLTVPLVELLVSRQ